MHVLVLLLLTFDDTGVFAGIAVVHPVDSEVVFGPGARQYVLVCISNYVKTILVPAHSISNLSDLRFIQKYI